MAKKEGIGLAIIMEGRKKKKDEMGMMGKGGMSEGMEMSSGMGMHDLGEMPKKSEAIPSEAPHRPYYPSFRVSSDKLPGLTDKKIGDKFTLTAEVVVRGADAREENGEGEQKINYDLEFRSASLGKQKEDKYVNKGNEKVGIKEALLNARNKEREEDEE